MRAVIQRVTEAAVEVDGEVVGRIGAGLLVLLGVARGDADADVAWMVEKLATLRIFSDAQGKMNRSIAEAGGALLIVSQFMLLGDTSKGRRPGFDHAAPSDQARALYERVAAGLKARGLPVETGQFGAVMRVSLVNDGPVTLILDSRGGLDEGPG
ncbi:D-aminoacyl-tRNA deacylase [Nitrospira sp. Kam-Ns4a]